MPLARGFVGRAWAVLMRGIDADAGIAPHDAQPTLIVHGIEQASRGIRRAPPIICHPAVGEVVVDFARMHDAAFADEVEQELRPLSVPGRPR